MATEIVGARLYGFGASGSMGVVTDTVYRRCFWPRLAQPTAIFAVGSSGIVVEGPPTPRNVVFPPGTGFAKGTRGNCFYFRDANDIVEISEAECALFVAGSATKSALKLGKPVYDLKTGQPK